MPRMTRNGLPEAAKGLLRILLLAGLLALAGCGPGTGGTGTGPITFAATTDPGTGPAICIGDCTAVHLRLEEAEVELRAGCLRFVGGGWSVSGSGQTRVEGRIETADGSGPSAPGMLLLEFAGDPQASEQVTVTVLDADGAALLGPRVLSRSDGGTGPAGCSR